MESRINECIQLCSEGNYQDANNLLPDLKEKITLLNFLPDDQILEFVQLFELDPIELFFAYYGKPINLIHFHHIGIIDLANLDQERLTKRGFAENLAQAQKDMIQKLIEIDENTKKVLDDENNLKIINRELKLVVTKKKYKKFLSGVGQHFKPWDSRSQKILVQYNPKLANFRGGFPIYKVANKNLSKVYEHIVELNKHGIDDNFCKWFNERFNI